jgi:hypothetical protein
MTFRHWAFPELATGMKPGMRQSSSASRGRPPSSGGKSLSVETVLRFFPAEAVCCVTAISDRALAYTDAELKHRFLVIYEAARIVQPILGGLQQTHDLFV